MKIIYTELITFLLGGVIGVLFKYWYDYKSMVYKTLWEKRYESYKRMFCLSGILPLYPEKSKVTYEELLKVSESMRDWYFNEGAGLILSNKCRDFYFDLQKKIQGSVKIRKDDLTQLVIDEYEDIQKMFSNLRTEMTNDLMSRSRLKGLLSKKRGA